MCVCGCEGEREGKWSVVGKGADTKDCDRLLAGQAGGWVINRSIETDEVNQRGRLSALARVWVGHDGRSDTRAAFVWPSGCSVVVGVAANQRPQCSVALWPSSPFSEGDNRLHLTFAAFLKASSERPPLLSPSLFPSLFPTVFSAHSLTHSLAPSSL